MRAFAECAQTEDPLFAGYAILLVAVPRFTLFVYTWYLIGVNGRYRALKKIAKQEAKS